MPDIDWTRYREHRICGFGVHRRQRRRGGSVGRFRGQAGHGATLHRCAGRNEGFAALKRLRPDVRLVQFVDGDCELVSGWLNAALPFIAERSDIAVVCGRRRERHPDASVYNRLCDLEWDTPIGEAPACGGDSLVRVEAFDAVSGFRPQLIAGEEPELCLRLRQRGWRILRLDAEMTWHDAAIARFGQWWVRTVRSGYGYAEVSWLHRNSTLGIWRRELARAAFWGGLVPVAIGAGAFVHPVAIAAAAIYPFQVCRIALRGGRLRRNPGPMRYS